MSTNQTEQSSDRETTYVILDTATTLIEDYDTSKCRLLRLTYIISTSKDHILKRDYYVKPEGFTSNGEEIHGLSQEFLESEGLPLVQVLSTFTSDIVSNGVSVLVCHNVDFDFSVLYREYVRGYPGAYPGLDPNRIGDVPAEAAAEAVAYSKFMLIPLTTLKMYCTCKGRAVNDYCEQFFWRRKFPKLDELHRILFGENVERGDNTDDTSKCFFELMRRGIIDASSITDIVIRQ